MAMFTVPGRLDPSPVPPEIASHVREVKPRQSVTVDVTRGAERPTELDPAECVELEFARGVRLWTRSDDLQRDLGLTPDRDGGPLMLPRVLPLGERSRGGGEMVVQAVRTFDVEIAGAVADFISSRVERGMEAGGQLLQCSPANALAFNPVSKVDGRGPTLVLIHGTASSTDGSFGGLWEGVGGNRILRIDNPGARINGLFESYDGRVLALQHRTLTESPIRNVLALLEQLARVLPGGAELHLVSHSRGGMIGELLCRGMRTDGVPFDELDARAFAARAEEQERLVEISRILRDQKYRITKFVRVACPAAGTTLADGRLDRYVSMLVNLGKLTGLGATPMYEALTNLLAAVLKERTDPASLPGLEAMMPVSPLAKILNRRDVMTSADLHVLGGDLAPTSVLGALKALATDFYYLQDHDLVVNTRSMLRGIPRAAGVKYWIDTGGEVSHFNYFRRGDTASRLCNALAGKERDDEFRPLEVPPFEVGKDSYRKRANVPLPILFVIPGFMGSHLSVSGRVWVDAAQLASGRFALLGDGAAATPETLVGVYAPLVEHLSASHDVVPFPYDWRLSVEHNARLLGIAIEQRLAQARDTNQPVRVLAHSSGGGLLQALLASDEGARTWRTACEQHPGARAVWLGVTSGGSHRIAALLTGRSPLLQGLAAIDLTHSATDLQRVFAGFDGLLELLPDTDADGRDWFSQNTWHELQTADSRAAGAAPWQVPDAAKLAAARNVRERLRAVTLDGTHLIRVSGSAPSTPMSIRIDDGPAGGLALFGTAAGDGFVTWPSAVPSSVAAHAYVADVGHAALATSPDMFPAIVDLLGTGRTARLLARGPTVRRDALSSPTRVAVRSLEIIPGDDELVASMMGGDLSDARPATAERVTVRVVHGNLSRATAPVVLGHYDQDVFVSAEDYLDRQLDGRLRELHRMRLYPGPIGTSAVVVDDSEQRGQGVHPGAVVVGLGVVGALTPGSLLATLEQGLTAYGAERTAHERRKRRGGSAGDDTVRVDAPITSLLVGSGAGGVSLRDSVTAILRGVVRANQRLALPAEQGLNAGAERTITAFINRLDLYELFEDRAIEAARLLRDIAAAAEFRDRIDAETEIVRGSEGQQRAAFDEQAGWWQRLRITEHDASIDPDYPSYTRVLKYEAITERARIDAYAVSGQRQLAEAFIDDAMQTTASDQSVGRTLFEMLIPNALKEHAPDRRDTVLLLDAAAAAIPWELLEDGFEPNARPLAVEAGMIRQLVEPHGRERVLQAVGKTALVIGNPPVDDERFVPLPGAEQEARTAASRLEAADYQVTSLIGRDAETSAVLKALHMPQSWRILHLATHGVFEFVPQDGADAVTGAVLGAGAFLQPQDFNQLRHVPELVFLNCCHGGNTSGDAAGKPTRYPELAANLATQFIKMGARAVVAAGWAVNDAAAQLFADVFYTQMLQGATFGNATRRAREAIYERFSSSNTWGAYQCYGDPGFSLIASTSESGLPTMVCERELWLFAEAITQRAKTAGAEEVTRLADRLDQVMKEVNAQWLEDPRAFVALGAAFGELRRFDRAIDFLTRARDAETADVPVRALEQLANLQSRYAEHLWREGGRAADGALRTQVDDLFEKAERMLTSLMLLAETSERLSLLGGVYKRRAMLVETARARQDTLTKMREQYYNAYQRSVKSHQHDPWYPLTNAAVAQLALRWQTRAAAAANDARESPKRGAAEPDAIQELKRLGDEVRQRSATSFWELSFLADLDLIDVLSNGSLSADARRRVVESYDRARKRGGSAREVDSVVTQIRFLIAMAEGSAQKQVRDEVAPALKELVNALEQNG